MVSHSLLILIYVFVVFVFFLSWIHWARAAASSLIHSPLVVMAQKPMCPPLSMLVHPQLSLQRRHLHTARPVPQLPMALFKQQPI